MRWRIKSPVLRLFTQPFIQAQMEENTKAPRHWPLWGEFTGDFPAQWASKAENVSIWWRHHATVTEHGKITSTAQPVLKCIPHAMLYGRYNNVLPMFVRSGWCACQVIPLRKTFSAQLCINLNAFYISVWFWWLYGIYNKCSSMNFPNWSNQI